MNCYQLLESPVYTFTIRATNLRLKIVTSCDMLRITTVISPLYSGVNHLLPNDKMLRVTTDDLSLTKQSILLQI
ncbi:hypothetical protein TNCT_197811 [Trichonephila clavata]|uniref:Uncharacterized protein n=1 Tax=Trichonephila clavata TaxID=2740835 RepID=A0A8X6I0C9_TRICU|nr:hypothetical protein TNCT_197811 [Trichonephila clavata]